MTRPIALNKGEWSEFYALCKILGDGMMQGAKKDLIPEPGLIYPVLGAVLEGQNQQIILLNLSKELSAVEIEGTNNPPISQETFLEKSAYLKEQIPLGSRAFEIPGVMEFVEKLGNPKLKKKSEEKADLTLKIYDIHVGSKETLGFSVKSMLGGDSSLFNAGTNTNFIYEIENFNNLDTDQQAYAFSLKTKELVRFLRANNCKLKFIKTFDAQFQKNLKVIDSRLDELFSYVVEEYYFSVGGKVSAIADYMEDKDPCNFGIPEQKLYHYKIKQFLSASALGMTAGCTWTGGMTAAGCIVVKPDGSIVCNHIFNWNDFQDYLFHNTRLDTGSTDKSKHDFGYLYYDNQPDTASEKKKVLLQLNLLVKLNQPAKKKKVKKK